MLNEIIYACGTLKNEIYILDLCNPILNIQDNKRNHGNASGQYENNIFDLNIGEKYKHYQIFDNASIFYLNINHPEVWKEEKKSCVTWHIKKYCPQYLVICINFFIYVCISINQRKSNKFRWSSMTRCLITCLPLSAYVNKK